MDRNCFWLWMVSNAISAGIHIHCGVWSLAVRDIVFFALAIWGLRQWSQKQKDTSFTKNVSNQQMSKLLDQNKWLYNALQDNVKKPSKIRLSGS